MTTTTKKMFTVEVDGRVLEFGTDSVTGLDIMQAAGIPVETGLLLLLEDGTQTQVRPEDTFDLEKDHRFKKRPRFKRGQA
jgi:uncharacterized protein YabE (DUF348 family)